MANCGRRKRFDSVHYECSLKAGPKAVNNLLLEKYILEEFILSEIRLFLVRRICGYVLWMYLFSVAQSKACIHCKTILAAVFV